jgi:photosystem II stability/assembly factor-like uncharacterized protein
MSMKKLLFSLSLLVFISFSLHSQWSLQTNPLGTTNGNSLGKIQFVSQTEGWIACGSNGSLLHTTNSGTAWNKVTPFPNDSVGNMSDPGINMSWVNPTHGWILKTFGTFTDNFDNENGAVLYKTSDGGSTWSRNIFPKSVVTINYSTADLQGTWQMHELVAANNTSYSSNTWAGWLHSTLTLDANGNGTFSGMTKSSDITDYPSSVSFSISSVGTISVGGDLNGFMSTDKNTVYMTTTDGGGGYGLGVMQRIASGVTYTTSDLQGTWQIHQLVTANPASSNQYADWMHGTITMDTSGNGICSFIKSDGSKSQNIAVSISSDGTLLMSGTDFHGFMSADKKSMTISMTDGSSNGYDLMVMQKVNPATSYATTDLQGRWQTHILTTNNPSVYSLNQQSGWSHGTMTLNANGEGNTNFINSNNNNSNNNGNNNQSGDNISLSISTIGIVTNSDNSMNGFMSTDKKTIFITKTEDNGGYTFVVMQKDLSTSGDIGLQVQFANENNGWASIYNMIYGNFQLYKTTDGGSTWNPVTTTVGGFYQFMDANNGWMVGSSVNNIGGDNLNNIYRTTNGGLNWTEQATNIGKANALYFSDLTHGWVVGQSGLVMKTTDGGTNWTAVTNTGQTSDSNSKAVFFLDANNGWIGSGKDNNEGVGTRFILATKDGGATWTTQSTPVTNDIFSLSFWDVNNGWLTSDHGQIAAYTYTPPKTVTITAGGLDATLTASEKSNLKSLTVTGTIDARDFKTMRDNMPMLASIDLSEVSILAYSGTEGTYSTTATDYPANATPRMGFYNKKSLTSVILPNSLSAIGRSTFNSCSALTSLNIPSSVTSLGYAAFNGCGSLSSVNIPSSVTLIDTWTFGNCTSLKTISIPSSVTTIGTNAFLYSGLENIILPTGLQTIGQYAFQNCSALTSVVIPSTLTSVGYCAFTFDNALAKFVVASDNPSFSSLDGVLFDKSQHKLISYPAARNSVYQIPVGVNVVDTAAFEGSWGMQSIIIPSTVTTLAPEAFYMCMNVKSIDIPASVTYIGSYAFYNCNGLTSITVHATPVNLSASDSVFNYVDKTACTLYVPSGTKSTFQAATQWSDFNNIVELSSKTANVSAGGLYPALTSAELSNTTNLKITGTIDARDFKTMRDNMPLLSDLDLSGVIIQAYSGTAGPNDGNTVYAANAIPNHAFYTQMTNTGRRSLRNVVLPPTITTVEPAAFTACSLNETALPNGVTSVQDWAFAGNNLSSVSIPATLSSIGLCAFTYNNSLSAFQVATDNPYLSTIDGVLFDNTQKTIICYPNGKNENVYQIPTGVTTIAQSAFAGWCLQQVIIPSSVTSLSKYAFYYSQNLRAVDIPASVTFIGESAFYNCSSLASITVHSLEPLDLNSSSDVFLNVDKVACTLYVPIGSKSAYQSANQWKDFVNIVEVNTNVNSHITIKSDSNVLAAAIGSGYPSTDQIALLDGISDINSFIFTPVDVNQAGTYTDIPPNAPEGTCVINIPPSDGENGYFKVYFSLPANFSNISLSGSANIDDVGRVFLNGHPLSASIISGGSECITENGNATFGTTDVSYFNPGINEVVFSDANTGGGPSGAAFFVNILFDDNSGNTAVKQLDTSNIRLYPNPATEGIYVEPGEKNTTVSVYNLNGTLALSRVIIGKSYINVSNLAGGLYIVKITTDGYTVERKLVKK